MVVLIKKIILKPSATDGFSGEDKRERENEHYGQFYCTVSVRLLTVTKSDAAVNREL